MQKFAVSLLVSVVVFAAAAVIAFGGVFSLVEARFYQPAVRDRLLAKADSISGLTQEFIDGNTMRFSRFLSDENVRTYIERSQTDAQAQAAGLATGQLFAQVQGLRGIRIIGYDNTRSPGNQNEIHYSSFTGDVRSQGRSVLYYPYDSLAGQIPYERIAANASGPEDTKSAKVLLHVPAGENAQQFVFCLPFYDRHMLFRATAVFYVDGTSLSNFLLARNSVAIGENPFFIEDMGLVFGVPYSGRNAVLSAVQEKWRSGFSSAELLGTSAGMDGGADSSVTEWLLVSSKKSDYPKIGLVCDRAALTISDAVKVLLLSCFFVTEFLIAFLIISLKTDDMTLIKERIRRTQLAVVTELIEKRQDAQSWRDAAQNIEYRREALSAEIIKSLGRRGKRHKAELSALLDRSWNEIIGAFVGSTAAVPSGLGADTAELKRLLEEVISSSTVKVQAAPASAPGHPLPAAAAAADTVEDLEEIEEAESVEEIAEAEEVEELEEADALEEIEEVEAVEEIAEAEEVEELDEAEALEEIEEVEAVEDITEADEVEELDEAEDLEEIEEVEAAEEIAEAEKVEELDEAEALEEIEEVADMEAVDISSFDAAQPQTGKNPELYDEPLQFGDFARKEYFVDDGTDIQNLSFSAPDFSALDEQDAALLEELDDDAQASSFSFTLFAGEDDILQDLEHDVSDDVIVQEEDGTFEVSPNVDSSSVVLDKAFDSLVQSVLHA